MHHELTVLPTFIPLWSLWDSNPSVTVQMSSASHYTTNPKFSHTIAGLSAPKRLIKTMSRKHPKSQQPICTSLGFFFPTSGYEYLYLLLLYILLIFFAFGVGFEPTEVLISFGRLTVCCLKPLGHPNFFGFHILVITV